MALSTQSSLIIIISCVRASVRISVGLTQSLISARILSLKERTS